jgi:hypothetical protein
MSTKFELTTTIIKINSINMLFRIICVMNFFVHILPKLFFVSNLKYNKFSIRSLLGYWLVLLVSLNWISPCTGQGKPRFNKCTYIPW